MSKELFASVAAFVVVAATCILAKKITNMIEPAPIARADVSVTQELLNRLIILHNAGASECLFTARDFDQAEKLFFKHKFQQTEQSALKCLDAINNCERRFKFFN